MPALFRAEDAIGTIYYSRFALLNERTLLFLCGFDGEFSQLMTDLAGHAGRVFDIIFQHVIDPPLSPAASNIASFVEWTAERAVHALHLYSAYPGMTVEEIKAGASDVARAGGPNPLMVILHTKSRIALFEAELLLKARGRTITRALDNVGTPHFAQFVPLEDHQIGFFSVYDGDFETYIGDIAENISEVFDLLFKFTTSSPPLPCRTHPREFIDFVQEASRAQIGFYQAYPGLSVRDIKALMAAGKS